MSREQACPFCEIIAGDDDRAAGVIYRTGVTIGLWPLNPVTTDHALIIPTIHVPDAVADPHVTAETMRAAAAFAQRQNIGDCNLITSVGPAATQTVRHLHIHVIPRRERDCLALPWDPCPRPARHGTEGPGRITT